MFVLKDESVLQEMITSTGAHVAEISRDKPVMLIFLRHLGCMFCKEALSDLKKVKSEIYNAGTEIVFVHMTDKEIASDFFEKYDFERVMHISDLESKYYQAFGLPQGDFKQLFGFKSWFENNNYSRKKKLTENPNRLPVY